LLGRAVLERGNGFYTRFALDPIRGRLAEIYSGFSRLRRLRKGLERARRGRGLFHVWFHPENLYAEWPRVENVVARFLEELGAMVGNGDVRCVTMGQLAEEFHANSAAKQKPHKLASYTEAERMNSPASGNSQRDRSTISA